MFFKPKQGGTSVGATKKRKRNRDSSTLQPSAPRKKRTKKDTVGVNNNADMKKTKEAKVISNDPLPSSHFPWKCICFNVK